MRYIVHRDVKILRKKKNFKKQSEDYINQQLKDADYIKKGLHKVHEVKTIGVDGDMADASKHAKEISWRATTQPDGPKYAKRYQEYLKGLPTGPSEEQLAEWERERYEKEIWVKIQKMGKTRDGKSILPETHEVMRQKVRIL